MDIRPLVSQVWRYMRHRTRAKSIFWIHSPFVFGLYTHVFRPAGDLRAASAAIGKRIEAARLALATSREVLAITDFGAGHAGQVAPLIHRSVGDLARTSARHRREGEFLYRLCVHLQPRRCLELGTNLGISTCYQAAALPPTAEFVTLEGANTIAAVAQRVLAENIPAGACRPRIVVGEFSDTLPLLLHGQPWDYAFVDGNHRYEATVAYFHQLLPHLSAGGCMVFDDINWSEGMQRAWQEICAHPAVSVSIELFFMGIVFVHRAQVKEHFEVAL